MSIASRVAMSSTSDNPDPRTLTNETIAATIGSCPPIRYLWPSPRPSMRTYNAVRSNVAFRPTPLRRTRAISTDSSNSVIATASRCSTRSTGGLSGDLSRTFQLAAMHHGRFHARRHQFAASFTMPRAAISSTPIPLPVYQTKKALARSPRPFRHTHSAS